MANRKHVAVLKQGVAAWNAWRQEHPAAAPDLSGLRVREVVPAFRLGPDLKGIDLRGADLRDADFYEAWLIDADLTDARAQGAGFGGSTAGGANFVRADLRRANLMHAQMAYADFRGAKLAGAKLFAAALDHARFDRETVFRGAWLEEARLRSANLAGCRLAGVDLRRVDLFDADLSGARLTGADLRGARLIDTNVAGAVFDGASVHGVSIWGLKGVPRSQASLAINRPEEASVLVDSLDVAQFVHLLLTREKVRDVIETMTSRVVLILGRFTPERKAVLDALAGAARAIGLVPMIFDFERAASRDFTETVKVLAGLSRFVVADITNPSSAPLELQATVPDYRVPFVAMIQRDQPHFSMFDDLVGKHDWVAADIVEYADAGHAAARFSADVLPLADAIAARLRGRRRRARRV